MDIYHSTYTQYIALMAQLKDDVARLGNQSDSENTGTDSLNTMLTLIDNTIDTASGAMFPPTGELLDITKKLADHKRWGCMKHRTTETTLWQCFRTLHQASIVLRRIADDCALAEANELSMQEMR